MRRLPYAISSRVRLARNLRGFRFPQFASPAELQSVKDLIQEVMVTERRFPEAAILELDELSSLERRVLEEQSRISHLLVQQYHARLAILPAPSSRDSILVNEEDHLRIQAFCEGFDLKTAWRNVKKLDNSLKQKLDFAYSECNGYLTTCPENSGTGMRMSVNMFVPGLILTKRIIPLIRRCRNEGFTVRGVWGEASESRGYMLQISNQRASVAHEETILQELEQLCQGIIHVEHEARHVLMTSPALRLKRRCVQAEQMLKESSQICLQEASRQLALYRLGCALDILPTGSELKTRSSTQRDRMLKTLDRLNLRIQPAHIRAYSLDMQQAAGLYAAPQNDCSLDEETVRAHVIQKELVGVGVME